MRNQLNILLLVLCFWRLNAQKKHEHIAFINATAHIGNGKVIESCLFVITKNKIDVVSDGRGIKLDYKSFDTVIDLAGKHIYPALLNTNNVLGLHDAESVRATVDFSEVGQLNPHVRAIIAYNTDNAIVPTVKTNGVLYTQVTPRGGLISGSSSIMALEGWNWEDAALKVDDGIHLNYPKFIETRFNEEDDLIKKRNTKYKSEIEELESFFLNTAAYIASPNNPEKNIRFEAMRGVMAGTSNLYFHADKAKDILSVINFVKKFNIKKPVLVGGKEAYKVLSEIKKSGLPVMLNRLNDLPERPDDPVDVVYNLPNALQKDSILFCLQLEGDMEAMHSRNLPFVAGEAVAYGLSKEQALSSVTLNAAKILGIDKQLGSLEEGKLASFVVSEGDLLDMRSNLVVMAYLAGNPVYLTNKQTELYNRYKSKFNIK